MQGQVRVINELDWAPGHHETADAAAAAAAEQLAGAWQVGKAVPVCTYSHGAGVSRLDHA